MAAHVFDFSLLSGASGRRMPEQGNEWNKKSFSQKMEYILHCEKLFALLYKEVSVKYILRLPHHRYRSFTFAFG